MTERVELSAQWRSSTTSTTGVASESSSSNPMSASKTRDCAASPAEASVPRPGRIASSAERRVALADERAERTQERRVGQLVFSELHAVAREDAGARLAGVTLQLVREARLPDARLTANEGERRPGLGRVAEQGSELGELCRASDEARARHTSGHLLRILAGVGL